MKSKIYISLICLIAYTTSRAQSQYGAIFGEGDNNIEIPLTENCFDGGSTTDIEIEVSGLDLLSFNSFLLARVQLGIRVENQFNLAVALVSPQGTQVLLGDTRLGSWPLVQDSVDQLPNMNKFGPSMRIESCDWPAHDQNSFVFLEFEDNGKPKAPIFYNLSLDNSWFDGEDPNGTWTLRFCSSGDGNVTTDRNLLFFTTPQAFPTSTTATSATSCSTNDGSYEFGIRSQICNNFDPMFYQIDGGEWKERLPRTELVTETGLSAGQHLLRIANNVNGNPDPNDFIDHYFNISSDAGESDIIVQCQAQASAMLNENSEAYMPLIPPFYGDNCGYPTTINSVTIDFPDMSNFVISPYDPNVDEGFVVNQTGDYFITWQIVNDKGESETCTQTFLVAQNNAYTSFNSPVCSDPNPFLVGPCDESNGTFPELIPVEVFGIPELTPEYGIVDLFIDAQFTDDFIGQINLIAPNGDRLALFDENSFQEFTNPRLRVAVSSCTGYDPHTGPYSGFKFVSPIENLSFFNFNNYDPNGTWYLEACSTTPDAWSINCWNINFNNLCSTLDNYSIVEENCQGFIEIKTSDIGNSGCKDFDGNGVQDYFISIDGGDFHFWDPSIDGIKVPITAGDHLIEFGQIAFPTDPDPFFSCTTTQNISVTLTADTEDPTLTNCPTDKTVTLDANGEANMNITYPTVTDNCGIQSQEVIITFMGGTSTTNGSTDPLNLSFMSGVTRPSPVKGAGSVRLDLTVTDEAGNISTCTATVTVTSDDPCVNDTQAPTLTNCPADMTISLNSNGVTTASLTTPLTGDNCEVTSRLADLFYSDGATGPTGQLEILNAPFAAGFMGEYDVTGAGKLTINWKAGDAAGNEGTCQTVITTEANDPCATDTEAPMLTNCPQSSAVVLDLNGDGIFGLVDPTAMDNCEVSSTEFKMTYLGGATDANGNTSFTSMTFNSTPILYTVKGAGTVEVEYTVTDGAGNIAKCSATITAVGASGPCMNDVTPPVATTCPDDRTVDLVNGEASISFDRPFFTDNCAIENVRFTARYSNGATSPNGNTEVSGVAENGGQTFAPIMGAGIVNVIYTATDPSGNQGTCRFTFRTTVPGTDALFNIASECAVAGQNVSLPVTVTRFNSIGAFSFDLEVPANSGLSFVGLENRALDNVSFNVLGNGDLRVSWDEPNGNNLSLEDNYRAFNVVLLASASFSQPTTVTGKDLVILSDVNDVGSFTVGNVCVGSSVSPVGRILSPLGKPQADVVVNLVAGSNLVSNTTTDAQGGYTFDNTNDNYRIRPVKNDEVRKGISIVDVALIRRHFLQKLKLTDPYKLVAADVDKSGKINVLDVAYTNRVFLRKIDNFPSDNTAWRYLPAALDISDNPLDINLPEQINLLAPNLDYSKLDFVSIKTGDVDHSALENFRGNDDTNNRMDVTITIPDTVLAPQQEVMIPVNLAGSEKVSALSFVLKYDAEVLTLKSISAPSLPGFNAGSYNDIDGEVIIGWDHKDGDDVNAEGVLMMMTFESKVEEGMSDLVIEEASAFDINLEGINVTSTSGSINFMTSSVEDLADVVSIKATPNPFIDQFNLNVETATAQNLKVVIRDVNGQTIYTTTTTLKTTQHNLVIDNIEATGVLLVTVEGESFVKTMKMIKM